MVEACSFNNKMANQKLSVSAKEQLGQNQQLPTNEKSVKDNEFA